MHQAGFYDREYPAHATFGAGAYPGPVAERRRVVVTGLGIVSPIGNTVADAWAALLAGRTGAAPISRFDASEFPVRFACEVKNFDAADHVEPKSARRMDRCTHFAVAAARQAERDARLDVRAVGARAGSAIGSALGGVESFEQTVLQLERRGPDRVSPFSIVQTLPNLAAGWVSIELGARGPLLSQSTACAASNMAIGDGFDAIRLNRADVMICGGAEAPVTPAAVAAFAAMRALSKRNDDPASASRPFDGERDGFVIAEAGAVLVLEELEHARARDAQIYGEVCGYGVSSDASHVSDPHPVGDNAARAIEMSLDDAGIRPDEVGYVNAHGTSTPAGDAAETRVLKLAFGDHAHNVAISSTKGATGHTLGAAGAVEAIFTILALRGVLPPTLNQQVADPDCDLDYVANTPRNEQVEVAVSNSFGFGGHNSVLTFRRWND
jgi:3-oxoacyl-[acyl-carrier-protein] synthase II